MGPEGAKDHCRRSHRGLPVKGSAFRGPGVRGSQRERARDMTYISLHLNQLWVQLRALDFQWCLKGWSKWRYKRMVFTKNTMGRWTKAGSWTNCLGACRNIFSKYFCLKLSLEVYATTTDSSINLKNPAMISIS